MEKVFLGDGSEAVKLEDEPYACLDAARSYDGAVWLVYDKSSTIVVRHAESGEDLFVVQLTEERPRCIASVPAMRHMWVSTDAGNMHVYEQTGALVGVFRSNETSGILAIHTSGVAEQPGRLFTTYADGTAVAWDAEVFRPFSSRFAGNGTPVRCVVPLNSYLCVVGNGTGLWIWNVVSGMTMMSVKTAPVSAAVVVYRPSHPALSFVSGMDAMNASMQGERKTERQLSNQSKFSESPLTPKCAEVWVTAGDWIEVYEPSGGGGSAALADNACVPALGEFSSGTIALTHRYKAPCPKPLSLANISSRHVASVDKEGYVTVWDGWLRCPVRMFKLDVAAGSLSSMSPEVGSKTLCLAASHVLTTSVWCLYGRKGLLWNNVIDDAYNWQDRERGDHGGEEEQEGLSSQNRTISVKGNQASFLDESKLCPAALLKDEVRFLRRKDAMLSSILSEYRAKTVKLARVEIGAATAAAAAAAAAADTDNDTDSKSKLTGESPAWARTLLALDKATGDALLAWRNMASDDEPLVSRRGLPPTTWDAADCESSPWEMMEYWKKKYNAASTSISALREWNRDLQRATQDLRHALSSFCNESDAGSGGGGGGGTEWRGESDNGIGEGDEESTAAVTARLSLRICELIRSYSDADSRELDLRAQIESLERQLSQTVASQTLSSALAGGNGIVVPYTGARGVSATNEREPSAETHHQKEVYILRQRLQDANVEIDRLQHQISVESVTWQNNIRHMSEAMTSVQRELADTSSRERVFDSSSQSLRTEVDELKAALAAAKRDYNEVAEAQHKRQCDLQTRLREMEDLSGGTARLVSRKSEELRIMEMKLHMAEQSQEKTRVLAAELRVKDAEVDTLREELARLKELLADHHPQNDPTSTMEDLQKRFESVVKDFQSSFAPSRVGDQISQLTDRLTKHYRLATQLKQKDDELAGKDDEIMMLREALNAAESRGEAVSTVFGGLPVSVEDVEKLMLELDEYRKRFGTSNEIHELVELRSLDIASRRRVYDLAEDSFPVESLFGSGKYKNPFPNVAAVTSGGVGGGGGGGASDNMFNSSIGLGNSLSMSGMSEGRRASVGMGSPTRPGLQIAAGYQFA